MEPSAAELDEVLPAEIAIIGAGVIGSALAMALAERGATEVLVIDPDLEGSRSSSELNAGGVRATFHQEANVLCSKETIGYFAENAEAVGYRPVGYLWLHRPDGFARGLRDRARWEALGWPVEAYDVAGLRERAPFIDRTEDLAGALFGPRDGLVNPNLLKLHYRARAKSRGVRFIDRLAVARGEVGSGGVRLECVRVPAGGPEEKDAVFTRGFARGREGSGERVVVRASRAVNCAGPWAAEVARALGYASPAYCVRRQISLFDCRTVDLSTTGMVVDPSGVYFHPEASYVLGGVAERETPRGPNFAYDGEAFFQEKIWLPLAERSSAFEALRHLSGWAGLYEVSPDESAIIGEVANGPARGTGRLFESHSYSGHGVMHSYACGVALAERLLGRRHPGFDLSLFSAERFERGGDGADRSRWLEETAVI